MVFTLRLKGPLNVRALSFPLNLVQSALERAPAWEPLAVWMLKVGVAPPVLASGLVALTPVTGESAVPFWRRLPVKLMSPATSSL
jgi:hypothetical protein